MFQGFSQESVDFLWGIRFNNERTWFEAHKEDYLSNLQRPMKELCHDLYEEFSARHRQLNLVSRVCRIYRDARRLHGRGPYKDNLWLTVSAPAEAWSSAPTFWFELNPEDYNFGLGYWMARSSTMAKFRTRLDKHPEVFERLVREVENYPEFVLSGEDFKRRRTAPSQLLEPWYNKKNGMSLSCTREHDRLLFSPALSAWVREEWDKLVPLYQYLVTLDADPQPEKEVFAIGPVK